MNPVLRGVLLTLAFFAEVAMLVGLGWAGWSLGSSWPVSLLLLVILPGLAIVVWGRWCAPRSGHRLRQAQRWALKVTLFAVAFLLVLHAEPQPAGGLLGLAMWLAFLASLPADRDATSA